MFVFHTRPKSRLAFFRTHTMSQQQHLEEEDEDYGPLPISQLEVLAANV